MKKLLFILFALLALLTILIFVLKSPPIAVPEENFPNIATSTDSEPSTPEPVVTPGMKRVTAGLNNKVSYNDILIEPFKVIEDSRCPSDVQCIQAGRAVIAINIYSLEGEHITTKEVVEGGFFYAGSTKITLEKVTPYPISTHNKQDSEYRFMLLLEVIE